VPGRLRQPRQSAAGGRYRHRANEREANLGAAGDRHEHLGIGYVDAYADRRIVTPRRPVDDGVRGCLGDGQRDMVELVAFDAQLASDSFDFTADNAYR
jgi:hypothetical protein